MLIFTEYLWNIEETLSVVVTPGGARLIAFQSDRRSAFRGFIAGVLKFEDESELHFREFIDTTFLEPRLMYSYHYQDGQKQLIFRYDNAEHKPLLSQPEHKHTPTGIEISSASPLIEILDEILSFIRRP